jgi:hypothetical protein
VTVRAASPELGDCRLCRRLADECPGLGRAIDAVLAVERTAADPAALMSRLVGAVDVMSRAVRRVLIETFGSVSMMAVAGPLWMPWASALLTPCCALMLAVVPAVRRLEPERPLPQE